MENLIVIDVKAVIFDLDGTITEPLLDFDLIRRQIGITDMSMPVLEAMKSMSAEQKAQAEKVVLEHEIEAAINSSLNDGAKELLDELLMKGLKIGVLTRNLRQCVEIVAKKHGLKFDMIVDRSIGPVKPDPFGVLHICEHFRINPEHAVVVGDHLFDVLSAKAAGSFAVLLKNNGQSEEFAKHANYSINKLSDLMEIIN